MANTKNGRTQARRRRRMQALWVEQKGKCYWCQQPMLHWDAVPLEKRHGKLPKNFATQEHLFHRLHPDRQKPKPGEKRWALACLDCNNENGKQYVWSLGPEAVRELSKRHRKMEKFNGYTDYSVVSHPARVAASRVVWTSKATKVEED